MVNYRDCHDILGVSKFAGADEIKKAFRDLAKQLHPDQGGDEAKFRELKAAYEQAIKMAGSAGEPPEVPAASWNPRQYSAGNGAYNPFNDPDYDRYIFFEPSHPNSANFERHMQAKGCVRCSGRGYVSKIVEPDKGFLGLQERLCKCQVIGIKK